MVQSTALAAREKAAFIGEAEEVYETLREWRARHPEASLDEIVSQVTPRRRELMGQLVGTLARQHGTGQVAEGVCCAQCGAAMQYKGEAQRAAIHHEGDSELKRAYYYCRSCEEGLFPPGPTVRAAEA